MKEEEVSHVIDTRKDIAHACWRETAHSAAWLRVILLFGLVSVCVCAGACSSEKTVTPAALMVSDVGELIANVEYIDGTVGAFRYEEVVFQGDISVAEYEEAVRLATDMFVGEETVWEITNYRVFPPSVTEPLTTLPDFSLKTCYNSNYVDCGGGRVYRGTIENGTMQVVLTELVWVP